MSLLISNTIITLKKYDRSLMKFYPYDGNDTYYISCWMILKPYMNNNQRNQQNANIKFYGSELLETLVFDLSSLNKIVFYDDEELDFSDYKAVPVAREYYTNLEKSTKVKDSIQIVNQYQYGYFEFNLINLVIPPIMPVGIANYLFADNALNDKVTDYNGIYDAVLANGTTADKSIADKDGNANSAFSFDGTWNDRIVLPTFPDFRASAGGSGEYSFYQRIYVNSDLAQHNIMAFDGSGIFVVIRAYKSPSQIVVFHYDTRALIQLDSLVFDTGEYVDIIISAKENDICDLRINGVVVDSGVIETFRVQGLNTRSFGASYTSSVPAFSGKADVFKIYNHKLTLAEGLALSSDL